MIYLLYKIGQFLALTLPLKVSYRIADIAGSLYYLAARTDRENVKANMEVVLNHAGNPRRIRQLSRKVFVNFAQYLLEFFHTPKVDLKFIKTNVKIEGRENLDQTLKLGKGVLLVGAHLGNWELGGVILSMLGYKINVIAWTHKNRLVNEFFLRQRQSKGEKIIPLGTGIRKVFAALKNNELVGVLGDIDYLNPQKGIRVKFFGRYTVMPKGPAVFSLKTGCPIIPVFIVREKESRFKMVLQKPILYKATGGWEDDLINLTEEITKRIELLVRLYPEQWFMITPRWPGQQSATLS